MSLLDRMNAAQECAVTGCERHRISDSLFCRDHLNDMWANRLDRQPDGTFVPRRRFTPKDMTGWAA